MRRNLLFLTTILLTTLLVGVKGHARTFYETAFDILKESPEYKSQGYALQSTHSNLRTSYNLPDPELGGEYLFAPESDDNRWAAELSWGVEWPGVYGARKKEARMKMTAAEKNVAIQRVEKLAEIKGLLLDYIGCRQKILILDELNNNNDSIYKLAEQSAKGGEMTVLDLHKVRLEYANIRAAKAALLDEEGNIVTALSGIYGGDCSEILRNLECVFPELTIPTDKELSLIKENAPAVRLAEAEADVARLGRSVAKMEALPSLSLGYKHAFEEETHFNGLLLGVSIPLFSSRGKQKAAKAEILDAEYKAEAVGETTQAEVTAIAKKLSYMKTQISEIEPIIENADYNSTLLKAYQGRVITLIDYLSDRNYFTTAALNLVDLRQSAAKAQTNLEKYLMTEDF